MEHIVPPFKQMSQIPANVYKTKTDTWNGYHSCELAEQDRDYTMFLTAFGRFRYRVSPQGFLSSGDTYNQRYGRLLDDIVRNTRCVDNFAMWDTSMEEHWWRIHG